MKLYFYGLQGILFIAAFTTAYAQYSPTLSLQEVSATPPFYHQYTAEVIPAQRYPLPLDQPITGVSLRIPPDATLEGAYVLVQEDTFYLSLDEHTSPEVSYQQANLIVFDAPTRELAFYAASLRGTVTFSFFSAGRQGSADSTALRTERERRLTAACEEPDFIPQSTWRAGLPAPTYTRRATSVAHVIVHHSATFNNLTDYQNVVRNIYLFHTRDRGWSDIGYNYLIAPDGTLFEGRSAGTQSVDNDNVQGAHFCGQNSGTMGVCLLGTYTTVVPTDTSLVTLERLTAWKVDKEGLDPLAVRSHPANSRLGTIAGHRDGCATQCPGDLLYARLGAVRTSVDVRLTAGCEPPVIASDSLLVFPIPTATELSVRLPDSVLVERLHLYDISGKQWTPTAQIIDTGEIIIDVRSLAAGPYVLHLQSADYVVRRKVLVR
ncbi:MAG: N-acetylmuramoyl-L-alanine amidase [Tunicatimonas sp.]